MVLGICAVELPYDRVRTRDLRATARIDVGTLDLVLDEALGLNCAWYADIFLTLTES